jgi:murein DD-endopeptidase MepM/ murein hydrolase activator NlpD
MGFHHAHDGLVVIDHGNGIATLYGHMHRSIISVGQRVAAYTQIGLLGSTGRSSGPHVHYEVLLMANRRIPRNSSGLAT